MTADDGGGSRRAPRRKRSAGKPAASAAHAAPAASAAPRARTKGGATDAGVADEVADGVRGRRGTARANANASNGSDGSKGKTTVKTTTTTTRDGNAAKGGGGGRARGRALPRASVRAMRSNPARARVLATDGNTKAWALSDGGRELAQALSEALSCGDGAVTMTIFQDADGGVAREDDDVFVGLDVSKDAHVDVLDRVEMLVEVTLGDLVRIRRRVAAASLLENERLKIQDEIDAGLRCEFSLGYKAMQDLLMDGGAKVKHVQNVCDVDRVVVDARQRTIRIVGKDAREVARARDMLEVAHETIEAVPDLALRMIVGKGGAKVNDIQKRTGAHVSVSFDKNSVFVRGCPSAVKSAMILVKSCIKTYEVEHVEVTPETLDDVREELARLDMEWGGSNVHYVGGDRGNRGPRNGGRGGYGNRGD